MNKIDAEIMDLESFLADAEHKVADLDERLFSVIHAYCYLRIEHVIY